MGQKDFLLNCSDRRARVALSEGRDWEACLAAARHPLGTAPEHVYHRLLWRPMFRILATTTAIGVTVFWVVVRVLGPYLPTP